ncbi:hypothetical protein [Bartonella sp. CB178]|uniref:hypothetical protein n=1 Tax=Bartonella sp. CB178 TaxID=3112255 RepID=UPI00300E5F19
MVKKKVEKYTELTDAEKEMLQEIIATYQSVKMMSRFMKWIALIIFLFILEFSHLIEALDNILTHLKQWITKN